MEAALHIVSNVTFPGNTSLLNWGNWTIPEGCIMVLLSQIDFLPGRNSDSIVNPDEMRVCLKVRPCVLMLLFLVGGPGNVINMVVFYKQGLKDRVMLCLFFLALNDGIRLTVGMLFEAEELYMRFVSSKEFHSLFTFVTDNKLLIILGLHYVFPILFSVIAVERCLCVFHPLKAQNLMRTRTMGLIIVLVYICVYSLSFPMFMRFKIGCLYDPVYNVRIETYLEDKLYTDNKELVQAIESIIFGIVVLGGSVLVVAISTFLTIVKLRQMKKWRSESSSFSPRDESVTVMLVAFSVFFVICVSPMALFNFVRLFFPEVDETERQHNFYLCSLWTLEEGTMVISACSVFVFYAMGSRYRETFWAVFGRRKKKKASVVTSGGHM